WRGSHDDTGAGGAKIVVSFSDSDRINHPAVIRYTEIGSKPPLELYIVTHSGGGQIDRGCNPPQSCSGPCQTPAQGVGVGINQCHIVAAGDESSPGCDYVHIRTAVDAHVQDAAIVAALGDVVVPEGQLCGGVSNGKTGGNQVGFTGIAGLSRPHTIGRR